MTQDIDLNISNEFIKENKLFIPKELHKKGGPYNKNERIKIQNEVYRLHFEYGYSAVKISEIMKINRNTINGYIDQWNSKILKHINIFYPEHVILILLERFEIQRTRLREQLDKVTNFQEKIILERLICDIDLKILNTYQKLAESSYRVHKYATEWLNDTLKKRNVDKRYLTFYDTISVSEKAKERIKSIINEDRKKVQRNGKI